MNDETLIPQSSASPLARQSVLTGVGNSANIETGGAKKNETNPAGILAHAGTKGRRGIP